MSRDEVLSALRRRVLAAMRAGQVGRGDRLPSVRAVAAELGADPRFVLDAYRALGAEGLVELRPRSGIYAAAGAPDGEEGPAPEGWLVELLVDATSRQIPVATAVEWLRRAHATLRLHALVVARTVDQRAGIARELRDQYGLETGELAPAALGAADGVRLLRRTDLVVTTDGCAAEVRAAVEPVGKRVILASVRPDLVGDEWRRLLEHPVYLVVVDPAFGELVRSYLSAVPGAERMQVLAVDRDDPASIPDAATVYVTTSARDRLGDRVVPGRLLPPARIFSSESSRELLRWIVRANLAAHAAGAAAAASLEPT